LKKHESSVPLLFESLLQQGNFMKIIVVLLYIFFYFVFLGETKHRPVIHGK